MKEDPRDVVMEPSQWRTSRRAVYQSSCPTHLYTGPSTTNSHSHIHSVFIKVLVQLIYTQVQQQTVTVTYIQCLSKFLSNSFIHRSFNNKQSQSHTFSVYQSSCPTHLYTGPSTTNTHTHIHSVFFTCPHYKLTNCSFVIQNDVMDFTD